MKRRYQIDQQRAVQEFRQLAREQNPNIQMILPMADVVGLLQAGVGHLLREAGLALMNLVAHKLDDGFSERIPKSSGRGSDGRTLTCLHITPTAPAKRNFRPKAECWRRCARK